MTTMLEEMKDLAEAFRGCQGGEVTITQDMADRLEMEGDLTPTGGVIVPAPEFVDAVDNMTPKKASKRKVRTFKEGPPELKTQIPLEGAKPPGVPQPEGLKRAADSDDMERSLERQQELKEKADEEARKRNEKLKASTGRPSPVKGEDEEKSFKRPHTGGKGGGGPQ